jgi:hypothetical protein
MSGGVSVGRHYEFMGWRQIYLYVEFDYRMVRGFIWPFYPVIPWGPFRFLFKTYTSAGYVYVLRLSSCIFDKSATDFRIKTDD